MKSSTEPVNICELLRGELCSQICVPVGGSYKCQCRPGFVLMADGKSCKADNLEDRYTIHCTLNFNDQISQHQMILFIYLVILLRCKTFKMCDQKCFDNGESVECSCEPGYELLADNRTCVGRYTRSSGDRPLMNTHRHC